MVAGASIMAIRESKAESHMANPAHAVIRLDQMARPNATKLQRCLCLNVLCWYLFMRGYVLVAPVGNHGSDGLGVDVVLSKWNWNRVIGTDA